MYIRPINIPTSRNMALHPNRRSHTQYTNKAAFIEEASLAARRGTAFRLQASPAHTHLLSKGAEGGAPLVGHAEEAGAAQSKKNFNQTGMGHPGKVGAR